MLMSMDKIFSFIIIIFLFYSCSRKESKSSTLYQYSAPIAHFDFQTATGTATGLQLGKLYEALYEIHPYNPPFELLPNLAASMPKISSDGKVYTIQIRKGTRYHSCPCYKAGREVQAQDFVTSFKRLSDPRVVSPYFNMVSKHVLGLKEWNERQKKLKQTDYTIPIEGIRALGTYTLEIKLKSSYSDFIYLLTGIQTAPIPIEAIHHFDNDFSRDIIGTGPYLLSKFKRKSRIVYKKNPQYREKFFPKTSALKFAHYTREYGGKRVPFIDEIKVKIIREAQTAWLNFIKGKIDYLEVPKDNFQEAFVTQNKLTPEMIEKGIKQGVVESLGNIYYFGFNLKNSVLKKKDVRKAFAYTFNQHKFNKLFYNDRAVVAHSLLPPGIPGNNPPLRSPYVGVDLEKARFHLKKAGFNRSRKLPPLRVLVRAKTMARQVGEFLQVELSKIGVSISVETVNFSTLLQRAQRGDYDIFFLAWYTGIPTGKEFFELIYGPHHPNSYNRVGFQNERFDKFYEKALVEEDISKKNTYYREMNKIFLEELPLLPLLHLKNFFLYHSRVKNFVPSEIQGGLEQYFDIDEQ